MCPLHLHVTGIKSPEIATIIVSDVAARRNGQYSSKVPWTYRLQRYILGPSNEGTTSWT